MSHIEAQRKRYSKWRMDLAIHRAAAIARRRSLDHEFQRLLNAVLSRSDLLRPRCGGGCAGWLHAEQILRGMLALAEHRKSWLRSLDEWAPTGGGLIPQFGSLARHLLATRPVPNFMTRVWLEEPSPKARRNQKLYKHLGRGNSVRGADAPIRFTKPMARFFMQAPDHLSVEQALRWSQVRALGGDERLATAVLATRLAETFEHERFREAVLRLLIRQPKLEVELIPPLVEYLHADRSGFLSTPTPLDDPSFGLLVDRVRQWKDRNPSYGKRPRLRWPRSSIGGFCYVEPQQHERSVRYWTVRELTDSLELIDEGSSLHHCVANYAKLCASHGASIWSMECHGSLTSHRVLTIQVLPATRKIITALGKCNSRPGPDARRVMEMWAEEQRLEIAEWV